MLCLCPAFPAISIPTRRVHITKSKGGCKTQRRRSEEGSGSHHGGRGHNHSHHLPISVLPHCSHGQTSPVDTGVQHYPRNHTVPWLSLETPLTTAPITDTPLPAHLLPKHNSWELPKADSANLSHPTGYPQIIPSPAAPAAPEESRRTLPGLLPAWLGWWEVWMAKVAGQGKLLEAASHLEQPHPILQRTAEQLAFLLSQNTAKRGGKSIGKPTGV